MSGAKHIILFDGVCNLCNGAVQFVIKHDKKGIFKFASLQSATGKGLLSKSGLPEDGLKSFVYVNENAVYTKSDAALRVAGNLSFPIKLLSGFMIVPRFVRDFFYDLMARNRYKIFGKKDECMLPTPALKERFL